MLLILALVACNPETEVNPLTPEIAVAPAAVTFGEQAVPFEAIQTLYVSNGGRARLQVDLSFADGDPDVFVPEALTQQIDAGDTWALPISFLPETYLLYEATLILASNDADDPIVEVPISGTGIDAPIPDIAVDPTFLDFGDVSAGSSVVDWLTVENVGDAPLSLGTVVQTGSGAFVLESDPSGTTLAGGDDIPVLITYEPSHELGDNGTLVFISDDPDEPTTDVVLLGNGGGDFDYPEAVIDCPGTAEPPEWLDLDGSASNDPTGNEPLIYTWWLSQVPNGSQASLTNLVSPNTSLFADIAGTYEVQLQVENQLGIRSAPDRCTIDAVPTDALHVELTWDTAHADLDLHLLQEGFDLFELPGDCAYCNATPDWGVAGTLDDPSLDLDDRGGYGPENINVESPADGRYYVKVHYYSEHGDDAVTARVRVYTYGALELERTKVMHRNEVWDVGQADFPAGTVGPESNPLWETDVRSCY